MIETSHWTERYRPRKLDQCILPERTRALAQSIIDSGELEHYLFCGPAGTGKTTLARVLCEQLDVDYLIINGSLEGRLIDTLRNKITQFASSISFEGKRKAIILDEADHLPVDTIQAALRGFIDEFGKVCSFILTCNYPNRIIDPIHSRCPMIDFVMSQEERKVQVPMFFKRVEQILQNESVQYDRKALMQLVVHHFPDNRKTLNELQKYSKSGPIDSGILVKATETELMTLIGYLKDKEFTLMRKWVASTPNLEMSSLIRSLYNKSYDVCKPDSIPQLVLDLADYDYKNAFVADKEINIVALLTTIMMNVEWK